MKLFTILSALSIFTSCSAVSDPFTSFWSKFPALTNVDNNRDAETVMEESNLKDTNRTIWIITTACLPWMTGTSINPLLRAAYLAKDRPEGKIHLMVPWVDKKDQELIFPPGIRFNNPDEQREYVKNWLITDAHLPSAAEKLNITFYAGRYHDEYHSIFSMGDIADLIPDEQADVCILEEPEHLSWFKAPFKSKDWQDKFKYVVGIIHTNYVIYARGESLGLIKEPVVYYTNQAFCRGYCHKIIKLSGALQDLASEKEIISNVHGVRAKYIHVGDEMRTKKFTKGAYFIGKMAWQKGLSELFANMKFIAKRARKSFSIDIYGQGQNAKEIQDYATQQKLPAKFFGAKDHALLKEYKVFVNPSLSEVLCTTIVEAIAMGKWVVCAKHPSNEFFEQFPNCLMFRNEEEFAANVQWALHNDPLPLTEQQRYTLTWEAATERLLEASKMTKAMKESSDKFVLRNRFLVWLLDTLGSGQFGDTLRVLSGAKAVAHQYVYVSKYGSASPLVSLTSEESDETLIASECTPEEGNIENTTNSTADLTPNVI